MKTTRILPAVFALLLAALLAFPAFGAVYQWVDKDGTVNFSDDLYSVPPSYRKTVKTIQTPAPSAADPVDGEVSIPFEKTSSGIFLVDVVLNRSVRAKMVFDTGANLVVISRELSQRMGQAVSSGRQSIRMRTAGGEVEGRLISIPQIEIGPVLKENVRAVVHAQGNLFQGFDGLLGLSFLEGFQITIDVEGRRIILKRK